jgi:hypothetical protein
MKNGVAFLALVPAADVDPAVWDPHVHAHTAADQPPLREFVRASKPTRDRAVATAMVAPWAAIEYRHVPSSSYGTFAFEPSDQSRTFPLVGGECILFGTMRAYLGNVLVTPNPTWLGMPEDTTYPVKSEFLVVEPLDGLAYYWAAFLRSTEFLRRLPPGGGGTRPRLSIDALLDLPVGPHIMNARENIDRALRGLAEQEWRIMAERRQIIIEGGL